MACPADAVSAVPNPAVGADRQWVERLALTDFRNYVSAKLELDSRPVVLVGDNGAGKTNLLEAVSLLAAGHGLRRSSYGEITRRDADDGWAVAARLHGGGQVTEIGTGLAGLEEGASGRRVRIDGRRVSGSGALGQYVRVVWLTPAMDGLFMGPAGERRRFVDRLVLSLNPTHARENRRFERAMRQRNRAFETFERSDALFEGLEIEIAEAGVAIAAARLDLVMRLMGRIEVRREGAIGESFPWSKLALEGLLEGMLMSAAAVDVEDFYRARLAETRDRDRAAKRTLEGPHRSDLMVEFGPKSAPAKSCSTGEQKSLLVGLVLAHLELVKDSLAGQSPLLLLDEIPAHLDAERRGALFEEICRLGAQAWMTGTDAGVFAPLGEEAQMITVVDGGIR